MERMRYWITFTLALVLVAGCGSGPGSSFNPPESPSLTATGTTAPAPTPTTTIPATPATPEPPTPPAAPVAAFSATPTTGQHPLAVSFTDASTGAVTGWAWNFGDGASSTERSPGHAYAAAGTFSVTLTVTGPGGSNTVAKAGLINVAAPPPPQPPSITMSEASLLSETPSLMVKVENISGFVEATGKMVRFKENPSAFDGATLFVCPSGGAWCGSARAGLVLSKALFSAPIINGVAEFGIPVVLSMHELYFEALGTWVIQFRDGTLASLEKPKSAQGDFIAKDSMGNEIVLLAVLPDLARQIVTVLPPTSAEKAAFQEGKIPPVRDLPVTVELGKVVNRAYTVEVVNPAASFDEKTGKPPVRYLLDPTAFEGARICAISRDSWPASDGEITHLDLNQAVACGLIADGRALLTAKSLPGFTKEIYPEDIVWVVEFSTGSRGWGEPPELPNGPLIMKDGDNFFTRWVVDLAAGKIVEPGKVQRELNLGRKTPVKLDKTVGATGYTATFTNPAASFKDGRLPVRFLNNPAAFKGAQLCALGLGKDWKQAAGTTLQTFDLSKGKPLGCAPIGEFGAAPIPIDFRSGETTLYDQDMILVVVFSDGTRAWGEAPGAPYRRTDTNGNFFIRVVVNPVLKTVLPPS